MMPNSDFSALRVIDVHTHAFPDFLAPKAMAKLEAQADTRAHLDGTITALLSSMDRAGIAAAVVSSIATEPHQFPSILKWCRHIAGPRLIPFPSLHPRSPDAAEEITLIAQAGFKGIKLHPEYQDFVVDNPSLAGFYREIESAGLIILFHAGYDISFPDSDRSSPERISQINSSFPSLRLIASHLGGYRQWEKAIRFLVDRDIYLDTSYTIGHISPELFDEIIHEHSPERLLFGSDSPWTDQAAAVGEMRHLDLEPSLAERILSRNAENLLGMSPE